MPRFRLNNRRFDGKHATQSASLHRVPIQRLNVRSLRSKRFRLVSEQSEDRGTTVARSLTLVPRNCTETLSTHVTMFATFRFFNKLLPTKFSTKFVCRLQCSGPLDFLTNYCRRSFKPSSFVLGSQISPQLYSLSISKCWLATAKFDRLCGQNWFEIQIRTGIQSRIRPSIWRLSDVMPVACIALVSVYF